MFDALKNQDPEIYNALINEEKRQVTGMELIASENYVSPAVLEALGTVFTNKYSEGYPGKRYYGGQEYTDVVETLAIERAKQLFGAEHANVQPHSGAPANIAVYSALLEPGDTVMGMDLSHGGHLTHGHPVTYMAHIYNFVRYKMKDIETGEIDFDEMLAVAKREKPKLILAGFSAYPRELDYAKFRAIADEVGAYCMMDMAHIAGLIAGKQLKNPVDFGFDVVTSTTHKTLRGPRGGLILCKKELAQKIDKAVFPGFQGGPHMNNTTAKAVAFAEALKPEFQEYAAQVIRNAKVLSETLMELGCKLITNGTDNHMMLMDTITSFGCSGQQVETALDEVGITLNKNMIANDTRPPMDPSGIRLGTPAITTRGMKEEEMKKIAAWMVDTAHHVDDHDRLRQLKKEVTALCTRFPVPGIDSNVIHTENF
ncbi:serine hydroxymethyltransferase [Candidatus Peregrinibacteria bacterium CG_4_10_14_0_2_um_filter_43_11]|nr:MAG: serine hydroxymethyltransferase [Candidatus Peregrinibacteria bacterium CG_4_10_14_0_2_um_filter_43_11]